MKHVKRNSIIIFAVTFLVLFFVLKDNFSEVVSSLLRMDYRYLLIAFLLYFLYLFFHTLVNYYWVNDKEKLSLKHAFVHMIITQFFNGITPFSSGGQPMEVYMLKQHGFRTTRATNIIMQNFVVYQVALVIVGLFAVFYNASTGILQNNNLLRSLLLIGFIVNTIVAVVLLLLAISKRFTHTIMRFLVFICDKLKLIKDKEKTKEKWEERLLDFHQYTKEITKKKGLFVMGVVLNILALICFYLIPFFLVCSLHDFSSLSIMASLVSSAYVLIIGAFVPIPGATGGIEYGFYEIFGNFLPSGELSAVMLIWRFITYYFGMILGAILFNVHQGKRGAKKE